MWYRCQQWHHWHRVGWCFRKWEMWYLHPSTHCGPKAPGFTSAWDQGRRANSRVRTVSRPANIREVASVLAVVDTTKGKFSISVGCIRARLGFKIHSNYFGWLKCAKKIKKNQVWSWSNSIITHNRALSFQVIRESRDCRGITSSSTGETDRS